MVSNGYRLTTPRLILRDLQAADADALFRLNSDPDVMRYTGDRLFTDAADARDWIRELGAQAPDGFAPWAVLRRDTGRFMGYCGLRHRADGKAVDLTYRFFPRYWASGFATEAAGACLRAGFEAFGLTDIQARTMRENLAGIAVLQKLGMTFRHMAEEGGDVWLVYGVRREDFSAA